MKNEQPRSLARLTMTDDDSWTLRLYGVVGDDWDGFTDDGVADLLAGAKPGGTVHLNSPGGTIYQGMAVYHQLKDKKPKSVRIDGLAASMGSVIALAADRTEMTKGSLMMIHNPWNIAMGDSQELRKTADILDKFKQSLLDIYEAKTGQDRDLLAEMMDEETWLTADEAVEWGFADVVLDDEADLSAVNLSPLSDTKNMPDRVKGVMLAQSRKSAPSPAAEAASSTKQEESPMSGNTATPSAADNSAENTEALDKARKEAVAAERSRVQSIRSMVAEAKLDADFGQKLIDDGVSEAEAKASVQRLADYLAKTQEDITNRTTVEITRDERDTVRAGAAKALLARWNPRSYKIDDASRQFAGLSLPEMAREMAEARGVKTRGMTRHQIAKAALHTTSDFPAVLENVIGKSLRDRYEMAPRTFLNLANQSTLPDYKEVSRAQLGEAPKLDKVLEGGEYTYGTTGDAAEKYNLVKYGKILAVTAETIINDDLDAFTRVPAMMGAAAGQLESDLFWAHFTGNPAMHDGENLFSAAHANQAGSGGAISITTIGAGRTAMRKQKGLNGEHFINVQPRFIVVPAALETVAEQFVSTNMTADAAGSINPFAGRLQVVSEPRLDAASAAAWYLWADPAMIDTIEYAYLQGEEGPQIETEEGFDVDGLKVKVRHNFGVKALDWRGLYRNAG